MTVAELLASSRQDAKQARYQPALDARLAAHDLDPDHSDPAWLTDLENARGERHRDPRTPLPERLQRHHAKFVAYFEQQISANSGLQMAPRHGENTLNFLNNG